MIKVLFVDDEVMAMEYLQNMISWEEEGFSVIGHARSGKKALEIYEREKYRCGGNSAFCLPGL